jgi:hypothetical protein
MPVVIGMMVVKAMTLQLAQSAPGELTHGTLLLAEAVSLPAGIVRVGPVPHAIGIIGGSTGRVNP